MPQFDVVVKNGMIIDGTGAPRFRDDLGIKDGRIAKIGRIAPHEAARLIDADGLVVAPGFIGMYGSRFTPFGWRSSASMNCGYVSQSKLSAACIDFSGIASVRTIVSIERSASGFRTGAKPKPQLPITTDVTPCQPEIVR